jgi:hypothetical protein
VPLGSSSAAFIFRGRFSGAGIALAARLSGAQFFGKKWSLCVAGQPPFKPTPSQRRDVETLKAESWSNDRIAHVLGVSRPTLEKHFVQELQHGRDRVQLETLRSLRKLAKKNASANRQQLDRLAAAGTLRPDQPDPPKEPKLGKKEQQQLAAEKPDQSTDMGAMMASRMATVRKLN